MSTHLKLGDKVSFLNEVGRGVIIEAKDGRFLVEDEHGFENWYFPQNLVPVMNVSDHQLIGKSELHSKNRLTSESSPSIQKKGVVERKIDLHMENLVESQNGMTNHDILLTQIRHFKQFLARTEKEKIGRLIVVHGQGTGKLKAELRDIVRDIKGAEMFDADYLSYGQGASVIERKYNVR